MINSYWNQFRDYQLLPVGYARFPGSNTVTVIVGKNGTGKSRLLKGVVGDLLVEDVERGLFDREERSVRFGFGRSGITFFKRPKKVICVSTSPFDRFPLLKRGVSSQYYSYLGLRGLPSSNLSTAYMSRIVSSLIRAMLNDPRRSLAVSEVLNYLGYQGAIRCVFSVGLPSRMQDEILNSSDPVLTVANLKPSPFISQDGTNVIRQLREATPFELHTAINYLRYFRESGRKPRVDLHLNLDGVHLEDGDIEGVVALISTGLARLREVSIKKSGHGIEMESFFLSEASSGEQSVVMSFLGIASQIEDDSLICVDEPEVCLHPEWQERYVHLLLDLFANRKGCQFLIATHSPQIVAELPVANCFVMNMEDGIVSDTRTLSHRSVDFQLANVFKTPGRQNEYLNRVAVSLFSKIAKEKKFSAEDEPVFLLLLSLYEKINESDPLKEIINALKGMREAYA